MGARSKHYYVSEGPQQTGLIPVNNSAMANTSPYNPAAAVAVRCSMQNNTAEQGGGMVAVPPPREGSTTTTRTERQRVDRSLLKAPPETMPTLVALQPPGAQPPIGPPPPYPRRTNHTPSQNLPAILAIHPQASLGITVSPLDESFCDVEIDGDGSSVVGVAVGGGRDISGGDNSGGDNYSSDQVNPYEVDNDSDGSSEDDDKASNPNCLDYSTDEDDVDNYIFDPDLEEFELVDFVNPNKGSKISREQGGYVGGPQPPDYSTMNPVDKKVAESEFIWERRRWCFEQQRSRMTNLSEGVTDFNGVLMETLCTMQQGEEGTPLLVGQSFPSRDIIMLQSAEEANLRGIHVIVHKSDKHTFKAYGNQFYVNASNSESGGWKIIACRTHEGDAGVDVLTPSDPPTPGAVSVLVDPPSK